MKHIKKIIATHSIFRGQGNGCGECQQSCQSACKTSCTVANQSCEVRTIRTGKQVLVR
ncbi:MAG: six-cysteine ranthipeptide SCIFF [Firmicutes bacterium]|nr:six-cysteine ranthipeptide SCIFF [Bacillota bacterium]